MATKEPPSLEIGEYLYVLGLRKETGNIVVIRINPKALPSEPGGTYEEFVVGNPEKVVWQSH